MTRLNLDDLPEPLRRQAEQQLAEQTAAEVERRTSTSDLTHEEWQDAVVQLAHAEGWKHLHVRRSVGRGRQWVTTTNRKGWPDLFLWHPERGFAAIELKVGRHQASPEQLIVLEELAAAGARVAVAYPEDLDNVRRLLTARR